MAILILKESISDTLIYFSIQTVPSRCINKYMFGENNGWKVNPMTTKPQKEKKHGVN